MLSSGDQEKKGDDTGDDDQLGSYGDCSKAPTSNGSNPQEQIKNGVRGFPCSAKVG